ncbi:MAG TPA: choice-of-anchor tandem repeat GloVer-containing protein [Verrucomicrobiae bacterium]|nr:choice-of-anchor tandem repeat GloVer-containing protein [Verrucomicrobiae bacterium]
MPLTKRLLRSLAAWASLGLLAARVSAQNVQTLHSFSGLQNGTNQDGAAPVCTLGLLGNSLYGTATGGGFSGNGIMFAIRTDGTGFTNLHNFTGDDGSGPWSELTLSGQTLYGTAQSGGSGGGGTVFCVNLDGSGFTNLYNFPSGDALGAGHPIGPLVLSSNLLYGATLAGGIFVNGTLFGLQTNGDAFTNFFTFTGGADGGYPSSLIFSNDVLYGTSFGGSASSGGVFMVPTGGGTFGGLDFIHNFMGPDGSGSRIGLALSSNVLYGTTFAGGANDAGTIFALSIDGSGFSTLHGFTDVTLVNSDPSGLLHGTNADGFDSEGPLLLSGNTLYGTTLTGGGSGNGTVFAINTDGTGFTNLHVFSPLVMNTNQDGANPKGGLVLAGNALYGTTLQGGAFGNGTVFRIPIPSAQPELTINLSAGFAVLNWATNFTGFLPQYATNLIPPVTWNPVSSPVVVVNGLNWVTNVISASEQYFRLRAVR